jgi:hypothetical protein
MRFFVILEPKNLKKRGGLDFLAKICYNISVHNAKGKEFSPALRFYTVPSKLFSSKGGQIWIGIFHLLITVRYGAFWFSLVFC